MDQKLNFKTNKQKSPNKRIKNYSTKAQNAASTE